MYANKFNVQVFVELLSLKYPMYIHHAILIIIFLEIKSVEQLTPFHSNWAFRYSELFTR
jgi:hypothetical protein